MPKAKPKPLSKRAVQNERAKITAGRPVNRAAIVDARLRQLGGQIEGSFYEVCELAIEAKAESYFARYGFVDVEGYLEARLGLSYRSVTKRLAAVEAVLALPESVQEKARAALVTIGSTKASIIAPAIRKDPAGWEDWTQKAAAEPVESLQSRVSKALGHRPRGTAAVASAPGEGWYRRLLALPGWPDALKADTARAFKLAEVALEKPNPNPLECWAAILAEFIGTYEPKSAHAAESS